ncbi:uncharacterized protein LOC119483654 isoform X1 [Sebastes umbrosus]|uniref:uncharacterized protein LOC119483654 isoform X1 n=1 Tax=Sebastes umbrosus TaxID=72105 RepID=UPI00189DA2F3|nr:uncharacterized protein LOC119483654 isoform X1 [Sebastes umbrosus]XP_037617930.1 uncharacterized protein LOC119483654 isoform X1 [Sebastes umbrosus]
MACSTRSALNYVKEARIHLVNGLKNHSVILVNLNHIRVLGNEEVSEIEAEKNDFNKSRKILDSVMRKGEDACYEFLRIIYTTRKKTLGRTSLPKRKTVASIETKEFDLHNWISCFSFKEDTQMDTNYLQGTSPCYRYQAKLKSKAQNISNQFWMANKNLFDENKKNNLSYMSLVLDTEKRGSLSKVKKFKSKKIKKSRSKKLRTYIPEDKAETSPSDLLKTDKNILLVGKPGIGKTALTHEMLKLWAERDNKDLDYMFYFDMRETSHIMKALSLEDLLFGVFSEPDEGKEEVLQDIKNSDSVTLIFDGLTDLSVHPPVVQRLVKKDLLPDAKVIVTCRPDDEEEFLSADFLRMEVKGFSEQTIKTYLSAMLGDKQKNVLSNVELLTLCHVPMYALMVAACSSFETPEDSPQPCSITEIYINIVRHCLQINSKTKIKDLNSFISNKRNEILSLAEVAFHATEEKTVNLTESPCEDSCVLSFLKQLVIRVAPTETITTHAFLHYTMQEFFAALWLLKNPDQIKDVFQQCLTEEKKHMKHLIPFMCRLLTDKSPSLMKCLIPAEELKNISSWFFGEMISTFLNSELFSVLFLCQCMYESQCPEACIYLLDKLDYHLDLSGESLHSYPCCAVAYVVSQSKERKISLDLEDVTVSEQGMRRLFGCLENVQWCDPLPQQLSKILLLSEGQMDHMSLLDLDGNQLHLPVEGKKQLFERAVNIMQKITTKVNVCLHWERETPVCQNLCESLLEALPHISSLSLRMSYRDPGSQDQKQCHETLERNKKQLLMDLCLKAALDEGGSSHNVVNRLLSLFSVNTDLNSILDFYQHVQSRGFSGVIPKLRSLFQSAPAVWFIDLSKRKTSILLEVLKLQPEKKPVVLTGFSDEESEVRSFLQCLPYISQLSFDPRWSHHSKRVRFFVNLFCAAAEREQQTGEKILELLSSVCRYTTFPLNERYMFYDEDDEVYQCDVLLDLYSHLKDYETRTGLSVLPSLQSVFQSAPAVWLINLSERKTSILLEVLKLQPEKKPVELTGWSDEESEVRSFLQCLPYISQLRFHPWWSHRSEVVRFFVNLFCAAAEREQQTGEKILELLSSVCRYKTFPFNERYRDYDAHKYQCDVLLDLSSHLNDYETKTGLSVLPSLQSVFQSDPAVWFIDLSKRKTSILLEVLKLQPEKKPVELRGCSDEESEGRSFLQCLPYISQLSFPPWWSDDHSKPVRFFVNLFCAAAEREQQTGEKILELLSSVCRYKTFPLNVDYNDEEYRCDFLLDLYSHLKDYETKTGLSVLPSLQSVFQSAPAVWFMDLSERKTSILLEVLKLQPEKKPVELRGCSDEESEVRSFLQCLPYISQLSCDPEFFQRVCSCISVRSREEAEQLSSLLQLLGFTLLLTGELPRTSCRSVGTVLRHCGSDVDLILTPRKMSFRGVFLLFRRTTQLHSLRLSNGMALLLCRWVRRERENCRVTIEELSLSPQTAPPSLRVLLKLVSSLASLLRYWTVSRLDLTEFCVPVQGLIPLLLHDGPLTIKLSKKTFHQLLSLLYEVQDKDLTWSFLSKVGGDLTSCCLNWELLHYLLQSSAQTFTVNVRKNSFLQGSIARLLPFLDRIVFKRPCPSFVLTAIREIYRAGAGPIIPSLLRSLDHVISLTCREMDSVDCAALLFTLKHSDRVKLDLLWTSIPAGEIESILFMLDKVSQLSVDRNQLLRLVHCCAASEAQQGAAVSLLRTVQHRLDLSCSSCVDLDQRDTLRLTGDDCRAVSTILRRSSRDTQLILQDCEVEDGGLDLLFPVLDRVRLRASKAVLLQLLSLVPVNSERDTVRRAVSLCRALDGELDLSHTTLDQRVCGALASMLDSSEELTELDLSHCQLTDQLLLTLSSHLHKVQVLDLSHNNITNASTGALLQLVSTNPSIDTVRLFRNNIVDTTSFKKDKKFEIW